MLNIERVPFTGADFFYDGLDSLSLLHRKAFEEFLNLIHSMSEAS